MYILKACHKCQIPQTDVKLYKYRICNFYHFYNCGKSTQSLVPHHHYISSQTQTDTPGKQCKWRVSFKFAHTTYVLLNPCRLDQIITLKVLRGLWPNLSKCQNLLHGVKWSNLLCHLYLHMFCLPHHSINECIFCICYEYCYYLFVREAFIFSHRIWIDCFEHYWTTNNTSVDYCFLIWTPPAYWHEDMLNINPEQLDKSVRLLLKALLPFSITFKCPMFDSNII